MIDYSIIDFNILFRESYKAVFYVCLKNLQKTDAFYTHFCSSLSGFLVDLFLSEDQIWRTTNNSKLED